MECKSRYMTKDKVVVHLIGEMGLNVKQDDQSECVTIEISDEYFDIPRDLFEKLFSPAP